MTGGSHPLPFERLAPLELERLCLWLVQREGYERAEHLGAAGSEQGRDVIAWKEGRRVVFQCKRVRAFTAAVARAEIAKLRGLPEGERPHELVFVVTRAVSAAVRVAVRDAWGDGGNVHFWSGDELDERVKRHPDLLQEFFQLPPRDESPAGKGRPWLRLGLGLSALGVLLTLAAWLWPRPAGKPSEPARPDIYSLRVQVLDPHGLPVVGSTVRVSAANEAQRLPDEGWEIEIPSAKVPADGRVTVWAAHEDWNEGQATLRLGADPSPRLGIRLEAPASWIRGRVVDDAGRGLPGARVFRQDGAPGTAVTDAAGRFALEVALPRERRVRLRAERAGSRAGDVFWYAGRDDCSIVLEAD